MKTAKSLWSKIKDKDKALRPSQLSMGRRLRTTLPIAQGLMEPEATNELFPLRPGDVATVKPNPGCKTPKSSHQFGSPGKNCTAFTVRKEESFAHPSRNKTWTVMYCQTIVPSQILLFSQGHWTCCVQSTDKLPYMQQPSPQAIISISKFS